MASFMSNFFPGGASKPIDVAGRPSTPSKHNSFIEPTHTPQGSPSKRTIPPGAHDLPTAFADAMSLNASATEAPVKLTRPQSVVTAPLSPGKLKNQPLDETNPNVDDSVIHKEPTSRIPLKKQGQENTPPVGRLGAPELQVQHSHAALSRQQLYEPREHRTVGPSKKFNTSRGLTAEERELLQKPSVKRLVNVTQLCELLPICICLSSCSLPLTSSRFSRLLLRSPHIRWL